MSTRRPPQEEHSGAGVRLSAATLARLRGVYDAVVEREAATMPADQAMTFRHACGLAWHRLDCVALADRLVRGDLDALGLLQALAPFVREALAAAATSSPTQSAAKRLH